MRFKKRSFHMTNFQLLLFLLLTASSLGWTSHIMTSDSREEPEFEMVLNEIEGLEKEKEKAKERGPQSLPLPGPIQPPIPTFKGKGPVRPLGLSEEMMRELDGKTEKLRKIDELTKTGLTTETEGCVGSAEFELLKDVKLSTEFANVIMEKVDMIVSFLYKLKKYEARVKNRKEVERDEQEVFRYALETLKEAYPIKDLRLLIFQGLSAETLHNVYSLQQSIPEIPTIENDVNPFTQDSELGSRIRFNLSRVREKFGELVKKPWYFNPNIEFDHGKWMSGSENGIKLKSNYHKNPPMDPGMNGGSFWSWPYFNCSSAKERKPLSESELEIHGQNWGKRGSKPYYSKRATYKGHPVHQHGHLATNLGPHKLHLKNAWLASYTAWFPIHVKDRVIEEYGELSLDLDLSKFEINQCGFEDEGRREWDMKENPMFYFRDTHKCDRLRGTSTCHVIQGYPWRLGAYECRCTKNTYAYQKEMNNTISGAVAEAAWSTMRENRTNGNSSLMYQDIVSCKNCPDGCDNCVEGLSCLAPFSWILRMVILCTSVICSIGSIALIFLTYKFRKVPVLKSSSPLFHCITLLGCFLMYSEMIVLFPVLSQGTCIAVKWTRHLGFCITYTALYMKLCRVFLTFRVKSAHKIKLTEKHLLHWMSPVMVVMVLYLMAWSISDPPGIEAMFTVDGLKFFQCVYNWWDHALAIGEVIFLGYGVWISWRIRENPDAQFISYSIYNIAATNLVMVTIHLLMFPQAGPDAKYFLAFIRTQLSTTVTIGLVFGSKLFAVLKGDPKAMKDIPTSANGFGHERLDLEEENQQLKEELTKMATQMERLKSYAMCKNNPHLKHSSAAANITVEADFNKGDPTSSI